MWSPLTTEEDRTAFVKSITEDGKVALRTLFSFGQRQGSIDASFVESLVYDLGRVSRGQARGVAPQILLAMVGPTPIPHTPRPLHHMVHISIKPEASEAARNHLCRVLGLLAAIPNVLDVRAGSVKADLFPGMQDRTGGISMVLYVTLTDGAALQVYGDHPLHTHIRDDTIRFLSTGPATAVDFFDATCRL